MHACFGLVSDDAPSLFNRLVGLGAPGNQAGGVTVLLSDTFTDTNGAAITSHAMDVGPGWTRYGAVTGTIQSNQLNSAGSGSVEHYAADAGKADVTVQVKCRFPTGAGQEMGPVGRLADASNYWFLLLLKDSSLVGLYEVNAGSFTQRASASKTFAADTDYQAQLVFSGTSITGTVDGGSSVSFTSSFQQASTRHGVGFNSSTAGQRADNFQVTNP